MFKWITKSFKRQITLILLAFGLFIITSFLTLDYPKEQQQIHDILEHQLSEFATNLALLITDDVRYSKYFVLSDRLDKIYNNNNNDHSIGLLFKIIQIAVVDDNGFIKGHTRPAENPIQSLFQDPIVSHFPTGKDASHNQINSKWITQENRLIVKTPIFFSNELIGYIFVDTDISAINALENELIRDILITFVVLFIMVLVLSHLFAIWIGKPLEQIIKNIDNIGRGNLVLPFIKNRNDEFHILGSALTETDQRLYQNTNELEHERSNLELKVKERTLELELKTAELNDSLETLNQTQNELIESAKMASLGELVAGVAHEINTPIGVCLTGASHVKDETSQLKASLNNQVLTKEGLQSYLADIDQMTDSMLVSLNKASELIRSFKQVSTDQNIDEKQMFDLHEYINVILVSQQNRLKKTQIHIDNRVPEEMQINSYAGIFYQIITNFISNSFLHGFEPDESGLITISAELANNNLQLIYEDDGKGMDEDTLNRIFNPFFTTKRNSGGTGLGMHIIYNLVTHKLKGSIKASSQINQGLRIAINVPL